MARAGRATKSGCGESAFVRVRRGDEARGEGTPNGSGHQSPGKNCSTTTGSEGAPRFPVTTPTERLHVVYTKNKSRNLLFSPVHHHHRNTDHFPASPGVGAARRKKTKKTTTCMTTDQSYFYIFTRHGPLTKKTNKKYEMFSVSLSDTTVCTQPPKSLCTPAKQDSRPSTPSSCSLGSG